MLTFVKVMKIILSRSFVYLPILFLWIIIATIWMLMGRWRYLIPKMIVKIVWNFMGCDSHDDKVIH